MSATNNAWLAKRDGSDVALVMVEIDGSFRLVSRRHHDAGDRAHTTINALSKHSSEQESRRRAEQWIRTYTSYGFKVTEAEGTEAAELTALARLRVLPTAESGLEVLGLWSFHLPSEGDMQVVVGRCSEGAFCLRVEAPGKAPRLMIGYGSLELAVSAARKWMAPSEDLRAVDFVTVVEPPLAAEGGVA